MIQYFFYGICCLLYLASFFEQRRRTRERFPGMGNLPIYPIIDSAPSMYRKDGRDFYKKLNNFFKIHGEKFYFRIENRFYVCFSGKEDIKAVLTNKNMTERQNEYRFFKPWLGESIFTTSFGIWKTKRKELYSFFHSKTVENGIGVFEHHSKNFAAALKQKCDSGVDFDISKSIAFYAMDVICEVVLGVRTNSHLAPTLLQHNIDENVKIVMWRATHPIFRNDFLYKLTSKCKDSEKMTKQCRTYIQDVIDRTKQNTLESLKDAKSFCDYLCYRNAHHMSISDEEMQNELLSAMFAGLDTMTSSISFLLYNLAKYPKIQEKVHQEIQNTIERDKELTVRTLNDLKYTNMVIRESLRLYPAAPAVARVTSEDVEINGYTYPAGTSFGLSILNAHLNPNNFTKPEEFIPERHDVVRNEENAYDFITFAPGVRACKGNKIAEYEVKTLVVKLLSKYKIELKEGYEPDISWDIVLNAYNGIWVRLVSRK